MFNSNNGYSLADIAAATGGNDRNNGGIWNDGGAWWIIILFLFCFSGWGNGFGGFGGYGANSNGLGSPSGQGWATRATLMKVLLSKIYSLELILSSRESVIAHML